MTKNNQKRLNTLAYNDLLLSMTDDVSFGLVDEARSTIYCDGDARTAWSKLMQQFESQTNATRVNLMGQFTSSSRFKKELQYTNPWITELELMRMRLKRSDLNDEYLMIHIMNSLPSAYDGLMANSEDKLDCAIEPLTLSIPKTRFLRR